MSIMFFFGAMMGLILGRIFLFNYQPRVSRSDRNPHKKKSAVKTMDIILIIIGVFLLLFTVCMVILFCLYGSVPDTLVTCVYATLAGECGVMGWIKTSKERNRERKWELIDRKAERNLWNRDEDTEE